VISYSYILFCSANCIILQLLLTAKFKLDKTQQMLARIQQENCDYFSQTLSVNSDNVTTSPSTVGIPEPQESQEVVTQPAVQTQPLQVPLAQQQLPPQPPLQVPPQPQQAPVLPQPRQRQQGPGAQTQVPTVYSATYDNMLEHQIIRVLAFLTHIQPSDNGKYLIISFRWLHSAINDEFTMNVFGADMWKYFGIRQPALITILRAMNEGTATAAQLQTYTSLITDIWIEKKVDIEIKNAKAKNSPTFWKNITHIYPVPAV
jgi:hypothetical protein